MQIADVLTPDDVFIDWKVADKSDLLVKLSELGATRVSATKPEIFNALSARETLGSTGMGGGVALPHARLASVADPIGIFVRLRQAIDYDAVDAAPVDLVFLLLLPDFPRSVQLPALACVARGLRDPRVSSQVRKARDRAELFSAISGPVERDGKIAQ